MIYIALLRGINVGGKNIIKMIDLKHMFESMNLKKVQTYIQSGNVLFESDESEEILRKEIEQNILTKFGFPVIVVLRNIHELKSIMQNTPFSEKEISEAEESSGVESFYVSMFADKLSMEDITCLTENNKGNDLFHVKDKDVYFLFYQSIRNSKLAGSLQKIKNPSTTRNRKTMNKLISLATGML